MGRFFNKKNSDTGTKPGYAQPSTTSTHHRSSENHRLLPRLTYQTSRPLLIVDRDPLPQTQPTFKEKSRPQQTQNPLHAPISPQKQTQSDRRKRHPQSTAPKNTESRTNMMRDSHPQRNTVITHHTFHLICTYTPARPIDHALPPTTLSTQQLAYHLVHPTTRYHLPPCQPANPQPTLTTNTITTYASTNDTTGNTSAYPRAHETRQTKKASTQNQRQQHPAQ
jgi:hypothetical protein